MGWKVDSIVTLPPNLPSLVWWNGIHTGLKILRLCGLVGSSPTTSTIKSAGYRNPDYCIALENGHFGRLLLFSVPPVSLFSSIQAE